MRKVISDKLMAGMLSSNFKDKVKDWVFTFVNGTKGTPAYWCFSSGKTAGLSNNFYDTVISRSEMKWINFNNSQVK